MLDTHLWVVLFSVFLGCYVQTVSGFAAGMIIMGIAAGFGAVPVPIAAIIVSVIALINGIFVLSNIVLHHKASLIQFRISLLMMVGIVPAIFFGVQLLEYLSSEAVLASKVLLGLFIVSGAALLMLKPAPQNELTKDKGWIIAGIVGGTFGGLFSVSGPPLVYLLYRQPLLVEQIRVTLIATFTISAFYRLVIVYIQGDLTWEVAQISLYCLPAVLAGTYFGHVLRPQLSELGMRRLAFSLLLCIGISVSLKSCWDYFI